MLVDGSLVVEHHLRGSVRLISAMEFHNGRVVAGHRRRIMDRGDLARIGGASVLPLFRTIRAFRTSRRKGRGDEALRALPWIVWLQYCTTAGELLGYVTGPGDSARQLN